MRRIVRLTSVLCGLLLPVGISTTALAQANSPAEAITLEDDLGEVTPLEVAPAEPPVTPEPAPMEAFVEAPPEAPEAAAEAPAPAESTEPAEPPGREAAAPEERAVEADAVAARPISARETVLDSMFSFIGALWSPGDPGTPDKLRLTFGLSGGYDDNVFATDEDRIGSYLATLSANWMYHFGSPRLTLDAGIGGGVTYYDTRPGDQTDYNGRVNLGVAYRVNRRFDLEGHGEIMYLSQPDPLLVGSVARFSGDYIVTNWRLEASYLLTPTFGLSLGYALNGIQYTDETINEGSGYYQQTFTLTASHLLNPKTSLLAEYRYNPVTYYETGLGSDGHIMTAGFQIAFSPRFSWNLLAGAEARILQNTAIEESQTAQTSQTTQTYLGPFLETSMIYGFAPGSRIIANISFRTEPAGVSADVIRQTLRGSLTIRHRFTGRLSGDLGIAYQSDNYDQPDSTSNFTEEVYTAYLVLRYKINQSFSLVGRYDYTAVYSDLQFNEYTRNITSIGLEITF